MVSSKKINAKCIIGLYELLEFLRCSGRGKHDTRSVKITLGSVALLKYVHYVPQPPFKIHGALHSKVCNGLVWGSFHGLWEGVLKVTSWFILDVRTRVYPVVSALGTAGQGLGLMGTVNLQITAVGMDWREHSDSPSELPLLSLLWETKMLFSVYCMMQVSSLDSTDPSTICCQDTSQWQE